MSCPKRYLDYDPGRHEIRHLHGSQYLMRPKTFRSKRLIPLSGRILELAEKRIREVGDEPNPYGLLFTAGPKRRWYAGTKTVVELPLDGHSIDSSTDSKAWHALQERAGIAKTVGIHAARRTAATEMYELNIPEPVIQDIMGHVDIDTTRGYRLVGLTGAHDALARMDDRLATAPEAPPAEPSKTP